MNLKASFGNQVHSKLPSIQPFAFGLEGKICLVDCVDNPKDCPRVGICPTRDIRSVLGEKIRETLNSITLVDLVKTRREKADNNMMSYI